MTENKEKAQSSHITNFLRNIINEDLKQGVNDPRHWCGHPGTYTEQMEGPIDEAKVRLRFPPEPNGYLHIGSLAVTLMALSAVVLSWKPFCTYTLCLRLTNKAGVGSTCFLSSIWEPESD